MAGCWVAWVSLWIVILLVGLFFYLVVLPDLMAKSWDR